MSDLTEGYVCAACDGHTDYKCYRFNDRWLCGSCFDDARIRALDSEVLLLRAVRDAAERVANDVARYENNRCTGCNQRWVTDDTLRHAPECEWPALDAALRAAKEVK